MDNSLIEARLGHEVLASIFERLVGPSSPLSVQARREVVERVASAIADVAGAKTDIVAFSICGTPTVRIVPSGSGDAVPADVAAARRILFGRTM